MQLDNDNIDKGFELWLKKNGWTKARFSNLYQKMPDDGDVQVESVDELHRIYTTQKVMKRFKPPGEI